MFLIHSKMKQSNKEMYYNNNNTPRPIPKNQIYTNTQMTYYLYP